MVHPVYCIQKPTKRPFPPIAPSGSPSRVSYFEPRLDFWRQLWRVLERSDVAVVIVDARCPLLHFSEALVGCGVAWNCQERGGGCTVGCPLLHFSEALGSQCGAEGLLTCVVHTLCTTVRRGGGRLCSQVPLCMCMNRGPNTHCSLPTRRTT